MNLNRFLSLKPRVFACQRRQRLASIPLALLLGAQAAHAANYFINTASDGGAFPVGIGNWNSRNLRWCIAQANVNPGSTITTAVNAPILLGNHLPVISAAVTISGFRRRGCRTCRLLHPRYAQLSRQKDRAANK